MYTCFLFFYRALLFLVELCDPLFFFFENATNQPPSIPPHQLTKSNNHKRTNSKQEKGVKFCHSCVEKGKFFFLVSHPRQHHHHNSLSISPLSCEAIPLEKEKKTFWRKKVEMANGKTAIVRNENVKLFLFFFPSSSR